MKITYATQMEHLESLQQTMEAYMYAPLKAKLSKVIVRNLTSSEETQMKAIISEELVSKLVDLYGTPAESANIPRMWTGQ